MAEVFNYLETSSSNFQMGIKVTIIDNDTAHKNCVITVQPMLRYVGGNSSVVRKQHRWNVHFAEDYKYNGHWYAYQGAFGMNSYLPNDTAQAGVVSNGELIMTRNQWYNWGSSWVYTYPNDGTTHHFGIVMYCFDTQPSQCPSYVNGKERYIWAEVTTAKYTKTPPTPSGLEASFDEATRTLSYKWDTTVPTGADWAYIKLWRNWYNTKGELVEQGYLGGKLSNSNMPVKEVLPADISFVTWAVINYSSTDTPAETTGPDITIDTDCKVWVKTPNGWKKAIPWVKTPNGWKKANKTYCKVGTAWKRTIM